MKEICPYCKVTKLRVAKRTKYKNKKGKKRVSLTLKCDKCNVWIFETKDDE